LIRRNAHGVLLFPENGPEISASQDIFIVYR
jgi:hypothetical protein